MAPPAADAQASARMFRRHQELMTLYSASTRRRNSVSSEASSIAPRNDRAVSGAELEVLKQKFQFIRDDEADAEQGETDWQVRMSVRYYRQLFREYALADLSRYKEGKIGLRWRTEMEVVAGKGQFSCGNKHCDERAGLHSYELLFAYVEHGERKRCLVKVRACSACAQKLFYKKLMEVRKKKAQKQERKWRRLEKHSSIGKRQAKRRRRSASRSESHAESDDEDADEYTIESSDDDENAVTGEEVHRLCAKINAQQKEDFAGTSRADATAPKSDKRSESFSELMP